MKEQHIIALRGFVDDKGLLIPSDGIDAYQIGARGDVGAAACVLRPTTIEEVSAIVGYCVREGIHIIPQSGNTGLVGGSVPDESGEQVVLSLDRMNSIIEVDAVNQSAVVQAGVRLHSLNDTCEENGLFLPIDLGSDPCIGGMVSTNTGGSRYIKYRGMRDYVMGLRVVLADEHGTIIDMMSGLHKNNTGVDFKQMFIGAGGIFGVVTDVCVRLVAKPKQSAAAMLVPSSTDKVDMILHALEQKCGTYLSAVEGMSGNAIECAYAHNSSLPSVFGQDDIPPYALLVELSRTWDEREGEQPLSEVLEAALAEIWEDERSPLDDALVGSIENLWRLRHSLSEGVQKSGKLFAFDVSFKRSDVMRFRDVMAQRLAAERPELRLCDFGHIGDGAMHCSLLLDREDARAKDEGYEAALREWVNDIVVLEFGGSYSAEHGLGRKVAGAYDKYTSDEVKALTRAVKAALAPGDIGVVGG